MASTHAVALKCRPVSVSSRTVAFVHRSSRLLVGSPQTIICMLLIRMHSQLDICVCEIVDISGYQPVREIRESIRSSDFESCVNILHTYVHYISSLGDCMGILFICLRHVQSVSMCVFVAAFLYHRVCGGTDNASNLLASIREVHHTTNIQLTIHICASIVHRRLGETWGRFKIPAFACTPRCFALLFCWKCVVRGICLMSQVNKYDIIILCKCIVCRVDVISCVLFV